VEGSKWRNSLQLLLNWRKKILGNESLILKEMNRMTDRLKGVTVTFNADIRDDDAEYIINAIKMIKGVLDVTPSISTGDDYMNRIRIQSEMEKRIFDALRSK
jgi:hypothetical protein